VRIVRIARIVHDGQFIADRPEPLGDPIEGNAKYHLGTHLEQPLPPRRAHLRRLT